MSAIDKFKKANTNFSERGEYLYPIYREEKNEKGETIQVFDREANYRVQIRRCLYKVARPPKKGEYYIAEFTVLESDNPKIPTGSRRTWMQSMDTDAGSTAVPAFVFACLGLDRGNAEDLAKIKKVEADDELASLIASTLEDPTDNACENALKEFEVNVVVREIITKQKQQKFNLHVWTPATAK